MNRIGRGKPSNKLTHDEMLNVFANLQNYLITFALKDASEGGKNTHADRCIMAVLSDLTIKIQKQLAGYINPNGYKVKLTVAQKEAIFHVRNEKRWRLTVDADNGLVRLLQQNS